MMSLGNAGEIDGHSVLLISFSLGLAWQALDVAVAAGSKVTAVQGCATSDGSAGSIAGCVFGIAGTVLAIGSGYRAAQSAGWFAKASNAWDNSGLESIALDVFSKLSQDLHQELHEDLLRDILRRAFGRSEFMGYVPKDHRISRRDDEHFHTRAPIFRISHPKHGQMDIASRDHVNGTRFTVTYANHGLSKRQTFQHERLSDHLFEGRFDESARQADPNDPNFHAAGGYQQIEDTINVS